MPGDDSFHFHWHPLTPGWGAPLSGGGRFFHVRRGSLIVKGVNGDKRFSGEWLVFFPCGNQDGVGLQEVFGSMASFNQGFINRLIPLLDSPVVKKFGLDGVGGQEFCALPLAGEGATPVRVVLSALSEEWAGRGGPSVAMVGARFVELVTLASRLLIAGPPPGGDVGAWQVRDLREWLETHFAEPVSLDALAQKYGTSPTQLSRLFSGQSGVTLFEYLNRLRIAKACQLLKRGQMPILEISLAVGYRNLSFFNRYFRRVMGMPPREYRLRMQASCVKAHFPSQRT